MQMDSRVSEYNKHTISWMTVSDKQYLIQYGPYAIRKLVAFITDDR